VTALLWDLGLVGKRFELGEDDELRVLVNHDRDLMRAVADGHAVRE
jgi:hypothetical protein